MRYLAAEIFGRLAKAGAAALVGLVVYMVCVGLLGATGGVELALLSWLAGAVLILLIESSPI